MQAYEKWIHKAVPYLTADEINLMQNSVNDLKYGADANVAETELPGILVPNSKVLNEQYIGSLFSDKIAEWIKKDFVLGPFSKPPLPDFRANSMFALVQHNKIRPIVNLSAPIGASFNDAMLWLPKVEMASSKQVAHRIYEHGPNCLISKMDMVDAFKLIPIKPSQWRLVGFSWLGKYFIDKRQMFGSCSAVGIYDLLHFCINLICRVLTGTLKEDTPRVLDDQMCIGLQCDFINTYLKIAQEVNIPLAPFDDGKKAFLYKTRGTMLGIYFDTKKMTWSLPPLKLQTYMYEIQSVIDNKVITLKELQSINGYLNVIITHTPILKCWRAPIIAAMAKSEAKPKGVKIKPELEQCLYNWLRILDDLRYGFPITPPSTFLPDPLYVIDCDAAGLALGESLKCRIGAGYVLALAPMGPIKKSGQAFWNDNFIQSSFDEKGHFFGCKTTTLEIMGFIYPLYQNRSIIEGRSIVINVDNSASFHAFENGRSASDSFATFFVQAITFVLTHLHCHLKVNNIRRCSSPHAKLADALSRDDDTGREKVTHLRTFRPGDWPPALLDWMDNPVKDPDFKRLLLSDFLN